MLVIGPFITLPARHSAVWVNAISPDSHNYPKIETEREISLAIAEWVRESLGKCTENEEKGCFAAFPTRPAVCKCTRVVSLHRVDVCADDLLQQE